MKRVSITLLLLGLATAAAPAWAQRYDHPDSAIRFRLGSFLPDGDSVYWEDKARDFTGDPEDFEDVSGALDFRLELSPHFALLFSGTAYGSEVDQAFLDFEDELGNPIRHTTTLDIASATAGVLFHFTEPDAVFRPYVGVGGGLYAWELDETGEFIDFTPPPPQIFNGSSNDSGTTFGYYWLAGFEVPIGYHWGFFAEGRWHRADDELSGDFEDFGKLDLSGRDLGAGFSYRF